MRARTVGLLAGGALLLVGLVALKRALEAPADTPSVHAASTTTDPAPAQAAPDTTAHTRIRKMQLPPIKPRSVPKVAPPEGTGSAGPALPSGGGGMDSLFPMKKPPVVNKHEMRLQTKAVEPLVIACAKSAEDRGVNVDGTANVVFTARNDNGKVLIDSTTIDYDNTTLKDQKLLECIRDTALEMKYKATPDSDGVLAWREIKFEHGKLKQNKLVDFYYMR